MSESEVVTAFLEFSGIYNQLLFGYVSLMSGFLLMSYLAAHKLPAVLASINSGVVLDHIRRAGLQNDPRAQ